MTSLLLRRSQAPEGHISRVSARGRVRGEQAGSHNSTDSTVARIARVTGSGTFAHIWRHALDALFDAFVLGGVFVVPITAVVALVSLWLPRSAPLHWMGSQIFSIAVLWFLAALFGAHLQRRHHRQESTE